MAQFASDAFTDTDGVTLQSHSANWTRHTSYANDSTIASNRAMGATATAQSAYYHSGSPASADYTVSCDVYVHSFPGTTGAGPIGRVNTGSNEFYMGRLLCADVGGAANWQLYKFVAGTPTQLGSNVPVTISAGNTFNIKLSMNGSAIGIYIDGSGTPATSATDSAITATGKAGLRFSGGGYTTTTLIHIDNFSADDIAAGSSAGPIIKHFRLINGGILMQSRLVIRSILRWLRGGSFA